MNVLKKKMTFVGASAPAMSLLPSLSLVETSKDSETEKKEELVIYQLKVKATATSASAEKYKLNVRRFSEGSPFELIVLLTNLTEIWTQNSVTSASDRLAIIRTMLRGEALSLFEEALVSARLEEHGVEADLETAHLTAGLEGVKGGVFPHRALEIQKLWMRRKMKKPVDLSFRKMVAAVTRINNSIPFFPAATATDKFSESEIIELLEWSIPQKWRNKFDLEGYVPSLDSRMMLITKCEALERQEPVATKPTVHKAERTKSKFRANKSKGFVKTNNPRSASKKFYCTEHGADKGHNTDKFWTLINKAQQNTSTGSKPRPSFSANKFRKELNLLAKGPNKLKTLAKFNQIIKSERLKIEKAKKKAKQKKQESSDSESVASSTSEPKINLMEIDKVEKPKAVLKPAKKIIPLKENVVLTGKPIPRKKQAEIHSVETVDLLDKDDDSVDVNMTDSAEEAELDKQLAALGVGTPLENVEA